MGEREWERKQEGVGGERERKKKKRERCKTRHYVHICSVLGANLRVIKMSVCTCTHVRESTRV